MASGASDDDLKFHGKSLREIGCIFFSAEKLPSNSKVLIVGNSIFAGVEKGEYPVAAVREVLLRSKASGLYEQLYPGNL